MPPDPCNDASGVSRSDPKTNFTAVLAADISTSPYHHTCELDSPLGDGRLRVTMVEVLSERYWVLVNFPGSSSLTLATDADFATASAMFVAATRVGAEALRYAFEASKGGG